MSLNSVSLDCMKLHNSFFFLSGAPISADAHHALSSILSLIKRDREKESAFFNLRKKYLSTFVKCNHTLTVYIVIQICV